MSGNASEIVAAFLRAFMSGDIETARRQVAEDFSFVAPMHAGSGGKQAYFAGAAAKAKCISMFRILHQWQDGGDVSTLYEIDVKGPVGTATLPMHEWHTVREGKIVRTHMIFDTNAKAVHVMREALAHSH